MVTRRKTPKIQKVNKRRYIGALCKRKHQAPGVKIVGSVRFSNCGTCCTCNALSVLRRKKAHKKYRDEHREEAKIYHAKYHEDNKERKKKYHAQYYLDVIKPRIEAGRKNAKAT